MELQGRVGLVTGAASGMGRATARRLVDEGMQVCVVDVNGDAVREVAEPLGALAVECDVSDAEQVDDVFARCLDELGRLDLAHLNAGVALRWSGDIGELDLDLYRRSVGVNLDGVVYGTRAAVRAMRQRIGDDAGGVIVATSSIAGIAPFHPDAVYTTGKHGVIGLVRAIAPNLAQEGIAVHALCPGTTETGMVDERSKALFQRLGVATMPPEEVAAAVVGAATAPLEAAGSCWVVNPGEAPYPFEFTRHEGSDQALNVVLPVRERP